MKKIYEICEAGKATPARRIYSKEILETEVARFQDIIKNRGMIGVLDVPEGTAVSFKDASHVVTRLWMDDDKLMAEIEPIQTSCGIILRKLIENNLKIQFSMCGIGSGKVNEEGNLVVDDSYRLIQLYAITDPAYQYSAYQEKVSGPVKANPEVDTPTIITALTEMLKGKNNAS